MLATFGGLSGGRYVWKHFPNDKVALGGDNETCGQGTSIVRIVFAGERSIRFDHG
jgi:hypothetical protein